MPWQNMTSRKIFSWFDSPVVKELKLIDAMPCFSIMVGLSDTIWCSQFREFHKPKCTCSYKTDNLQPHHRLFWYASWSILIANILKVLTKYCRSSHRRCLANFTGKYLCCSLFLRNFLQAWRKRDSNTIVCFPVKFTKF